MNFLFLTFRLYLQKNIQHLSENFWLVCQKYKLGVQANKLWENCFGRSTKLFNIFLFWAKTFRTFGTKVSADLSKMQSRGTIWGEKLFLEKWYVPFSKFCTSSQTVWKLWWKYFNRVFEFAFYVSRRRVWEKNLKTYILIQFPNSSKRFATSGKNISVGSSYLMSRCP